MNDYTKICGTCQERKELIFFPKRKKSKDGHDLRCKVCHSECYLLNLKKRIKYRKRYNLINRNKILSQKKLYSQSHKKEKQEYDIRYRLNNKDKIKQNKKNWELRNKNNLIHKIKRNLRRRINHVIKDNYKSDTTMNLLGCSFVEFKKYLESKFLPGMTWNNYGLGNAKWHIDHIRPCCDFDLSKSKEQAKCFHYSNMQPLWEKQNLKKSYIYNEKNCRIKHSSNV